LIYKTINNNWDNWYIELYEEYPCENKEQLGKREGEVIRLIGTLNSRIEGRTKREYYEDNMNKIVEQMKQFYKANKENKLEYQKTYYEKNRERIIEQRRQYNCKKKNNLTDD